MSYVHYVLPGLVRQFPHSSVHLQGITQHFTTFPSLLNGALVATFACQNINIKYMYNVPVYIVVPAASPATIFHNAGGPVPLLRS